MSFKLTWPPCRATLRVAVMLAGDLSRSSVAWDVRWGEGGVVCVPLAFLAILSMPQLGTRTVSRVLPVPHVRLACDGDGTSVAVVRAR